MAIVIPIHVTIDHAIIRSWAERRRGRPATLEGDYRAWPLRFEFDSPDPATEEIDWRRFFNEFERAKLAFTYGEILPDGALDYTYEFVHRSTVPELSAFRRSTVIEWVI